MGGGWLLGDLSGGSSGGSSQGVIDLVTAIATDPAGDEFASPVLLVGDDTMIVTPARPSTRFRPRPGSRPLRH